MDHIVVFKHQIPQVKEHRKAFFENLKTIEPEAYIKGRRPADIFAQSLGYKSSPHLARTAPTALSPVPGLNLFGGMQAPGIAKKLAYALDITVITALQAMHMAHNDLKHASLKSQGAEVSDAS